MDPKPRGATQPVRDGLSSVHGPVADASPTSLLPTRDGGIISGKGGWRALENKVPGPHPRGSPWAGWGPGIGVLKAPVIPAPGLPPLNRRSGWSPVSAAVAAPHAPAGKGRTRGWGARPGRGTDKSAAPQPGRLRPLSQPLSSPRPRGSALGVGVVV